jgi:hypothetical protein
MSIINDQSVDAVGKKIVVYRHSHNVQIHRLGKIQRT